MSSIYFSVIIPTLNRPKVLLNTLNSIATQSPSPYEIIVIDQSDNDDTREIFSKWNSNSIKKIYFKQEIKGLTLARNNGIDRVSDLIEYVCFLDDDLLLEPDFFKNILNHFTGTKGHLYAAGSGTLTNVAFKSTLIERLFLLPHSGDGNFLPNGCPTFSHGFPKFREVEFVPGGITVWNRSILSKFRFDDKMIGYGYGDDTDISYRVSRLYINFYEPTARALDVHTMTGRDPGTKHRRMWIQNMWYLLRKNVGIHLISVASLFLMLFGMIISDLFHFRRSALLGNLLGIKNILFNKFDSISDSKNSK